MLVETLNMACFWKTFGSERVNESQKLLQYEEKNFFAYFFVLLSQIELEKVIFNQIWDFRTAWQHIDCKLQVFSY